jgi:hypothetical protein
MKIAEKKEEILRLVEQLRPESAKNLPVKRAGAREPPRRALPQQPPAAAAPAGPLSDRIAGRRRALEDIKRRRDKMALDLLEDRLLSICQSLEDRISSMEEMLRQGVPQQKKKAKKAVDAGTELASNLDDILPDIDGNVTPSDKPAALQPGKSRPPRTRSSGPPRRPSFPAKKQSDRPARPASGKHFLSGIIQEAMLPDILQLISSNDKTGIFRCEREGKSIDLFFREGHLYHALGENMSGQSAFFAAMALQEGSFSFSETDEVPEEKTIDGNTQFMILEALRQIDEERGGE